MNQQLLLAAGQAASSLARLGRTLATAESCTGGLIAAAITEIPGASKIFRYGWVTYCNEAKERLLGVPARLIEEHTVVSEPVVLSMARAARRLAGSDYALAVSGNAGPTAGGGEPPVGAVCIALATPSAERAVTLFLPGLTRAEFRRQVVLRALDILQEDLPVQS